MARPTVTGTSPPVPTGTDGSAAPQPTTRVGFRAAVRCPRLAALLLAMAMLGLAGCGKSEFEDRTARVTVDGRGTQFTVDSCGLDGRTLFVVGRADDGSVLQAVVGLSKDRRKGVRASTGFSVSQGPTTLEAFGQESWERRGKRGPAPGEITSAQLRGSRIQFGGRARFVDTDEIPTSPESIDVTIDARCDQRTDRPPR